MIYDAADVGISRSAPVPEADARRGRHEDACFSDLSLAMVHVAMYTRRWRAGVLTRCCYGRGTGKGGEEIADELVMLTSGYGRTAAAGSSS